MAQTPAIDVTVTGPPVTVVEVIMGNVGIGIAPGGATGEALTKVDGTDFNTEWSDLSLIYSPLVHTHPISEVVNLQTELNDRYTEAEADALLDTKVGLTGNETVAGDKTFSGQQELTSQLLTTADSTVNRGLGDARYAPIVTLEVTINSLADLPTPVGSVITLATDNIAYTFVPNVDIGANRIDVTGANNCILGLNPLVSGITSTNSGALITCTQAFKIQDMLLIGAGTHGLSCTDAGTETLLISQVAFIGHTLGLFIDSYKNAVIETCSFAAGTNGIEFANTIENGSIQTCLFEGVTGKLIDLDGCTSNAWNIVANIAVMEATSTFLTVAVDSGNIDAGGQGTISANKLDNTLNGTPTAGYTAYDTRWTVIGNSNITNSDVLAPTGWGNYVDSVVGTIALSTTAAKLTINGLEATTDEESLPLAMVDAGTSLWSTVDNEITPATLRDSYVMRVQVTLDSVSGNPLRLLMELDIGGAATPTIVVSSDNKSIRGGAFPQDYLFSFPFFTKETFMANNGQLFLSLDTGTAVLGDRAIFIERISSGVR